MVQICDGYHNYIYEGVVDLYNRADVFWESETLAKLQAKLEEADVLIFHNTKFDMRAFESIGIRTAPLWKKVQDTVLASHCLCSGESHALKYLAFKYLSWYNDKEHLLDDAVKAARQSAPPEWDIARKGHRCFPGMSGSKVKWYKMDFWLCMDECRTYGCTDIEMTYRIWQVFQPALKKEMLWQQYLTRRETLLLAYEAETAGYNYYTEKVDEEVATLSQEVEELRFKVQNENHYNHRLELSKPEHLKFLFHEKLGIEPEYFTPTGAPSMRQEAVDAYIEKYPQIPTVQDYKQWKSKTTQISDVSTFRKWVADDGRLHSDWWLTGTRETRQSIHDPALQTISKSLRHLFGPPPGYVWLDYDLVNIEMRRWTYLVGNQELIDVFEKGGSVHLLIASIIHPEMWKLYPGEKFKKEYAATWYQWVKNGNFSIIYGATRNKADLTYKCPGAYDLIARRFPEVPEFTTNCIQEVWNNFAWYHAPFVEVD